ncbi:unnamed protein product [Allacma fusca]|uniref:Uncharacterized protein n=1 Tax=Allacma fusca TaxID=39272 RepID=A0A8J2L656_9HEXA|nr:unnamed protein product [Allacma fusca]
MNIKGKKKHSLPQQVSQFLERDYPLAKNTSASTQSLPGQAVSSIEINEGGKTDSREREDDGETVKTESENGEWMKSLNKGKIQWW